LICPELIYFRIIFQLILAVYAHFEKTFFLVGLESLPSPSIVLEEQSAFLLLLIEGFAQVPKAIIIIKLEIFIVS
jgi:hypothetical protein